MISSVAKDLEGLVRVISFPDQVFNGKVSSVSSVAVPGNWPNNDLREYKVEVTLTDAPEVLERLAPGLTAMVELVVDNRKQVLQIPIQSVVTIGTDTFVYRMGSRGPERIKIRVGLNNSAQMEVLEGIAETDGYTQLREGEEVVQNPQSAFAEEIEKLQAEIEAERQKAAASGEETPAAAPGTTPPPNGLPTGGAPGGNGPPTGGAGGDSGRRGPPSPAEAITRSDTDGDGKLSLSEVSEFMKPNFAAIDADADGFVTAAELEAYFKARAASGGSGSGPPMP
jgi:HlyD family secretion protein